MVYERSSQRRTKGTAFQMLSEFVLAFVQENQRVHFPGSPRASTLHPSPHSQSLPCCTSAAFVYPPAQFCACCLVLKLLRSTPAPEQFPCLGFLEETEAEGLSCLHTSNSSCFKTAPANLPVPAERGKVLCLGREGRQLQQVRPWMAAARPWCCLATSAPAVRLIRMFLSL